jgi:hypothetical protein
VLRIVKKLRHFTKSEYIAFSLYLNTRDDGHKVDLIVLRVAFTVIISLNNLMRATLHFYKKSNIVER